MITGMMSRDRQAGQQRDHTAPCGGCMARHLV